MVIPVISKMLGVVEDHEMNDRERDKEDLITELDALRARVAALERTESELKRVAYALQQSETKFRKITEKSIVGVYLIQDDRFRYVNPHMASIFGYPVDELVDKRGPQHVVFPEDWPLVGGHLRARIDGDMESINYQFRGQKRTGEIIHVEVYGSRTDYHDRPAVIGTLVDITRRVGVERNLEIQLNKFQALYNLAMAITEQRGLEENLRLVLEKSRELLDADLAFIALNEEESEALYLHAQAGMRRNESIMLKMPLTRPCDSTSPQSGNCPSPRAYFEQIQRCFPDSMQREGIVSGLAVPVDAAELKLGVLCIGNRSRVEYTHAEIETLSLMGHLAALEITRKHAEEGLTQSEKQLRLLSRQLLTAQEDERKRVAQELHDGIGQALTALKFEVENAMRKVADEVSTTRLGPFQAVFPMIQDVIEEVGRIAMALRPSILDDLGVLATIGWLCREFQRSRSGIHIEKRIELEESEVSDHQKVVIFRILQEALNNVAKHSRADVVSVRLLNLGEHLELTVQDNGVGFDSNKKIPDDTNRTGFGLASMKERARLSGGTFSVESRPGSGTKIRALWAKEGFGSIDQ
jgi:PAS domain S-box-containing protein